MDTVRTFTRSVGFALAITVMTGTAAPITVVTEKTSYSYIEDGKVAGPATAVVEAVLAEAGLSDYTLNLYPWARAYSMAINQPDVLIYPLARTPEREGMFKWVGQLSEVDSKLYRLSSRTDIKVGSLDEAKRYRVGVVRDDVHQSYLERQGFTRLVVSAQAGDNVRKLLSGQIDLLPLPERAARRLSGEIGIEFATLEPAYSLSALKTRLYLAYSASTRDDLVERTRAAFEKIEQHHPAMGVLRDNQCCAVPAPPQPAVAD